jgi:hypothetical protein
MFGGLDLDQALLAVPGGGAGVTGIGGVACPTEGMQAIIMFL